jgi:hypothetical protein
MNITLDHDCAWSRAFAYSVKVDDVKTPVDCTGASFTAEIRPQPGGALLGTFEIEWTDQENGRFVMSIGTAAVNAIPDGVFQWDLIFTDSLGLPKKLRSGTVRKQGTITEA